MKTNALITLAGLSMAISPLACGADSEVTPGIESRVDGGPQCPTVDSAGLTSMFNAQIGVDSVNAYYLRDPWTVWSVPLEGGMPKAIFKYDESRLDLLGLREIVADDGGVYAFDDTGMVLAISTDGGDAIPIGAAIEGGISPYDGYGAKLDAEYIYFFTGKQVRRMLRSGGDATVVATLAADMTPRTLAVDETGIYFVASSSGSSALLKLPLAGGAAPTKLSSIHGEATLALDGHNVLVGDESGVYAIPKSGGEPQLLAAGDAPVNSIVPDDGTLYYSTCAPKGSDLLALRAGDSAPDLLFCESECTAVVAISKSSIVFNVFWEEVRADFGVFKTSETEYALLRVAK